MKPRRTRNARRLARCYGPCGCCFTREPVRARERAADKAETRAQVEDAVEDPYYECDWCISDSFWDDEVYSTLCIWRGQERQVLRNTGDTVLIQEDNCTFLVSGYYLEHALGTGELQL